MGRQVLRLERYVAAERVWATVFSVLGGPKMGGSAKYEQTGNKEFPRNGGEVTFGLREVDNYDRNYSEQLYILKFRVSKTAILWGKRLNPSMKPWEMVAKRFVIEGERISKELVDRVKQRLE